jgi:hypothetical protein
LRLLFPTVEQCSEFHANIIPMTEQAITGDERNLAMRAHLCGVLIA